MIPCSVAIAITITYHHGITITAIRNNSEFRQKAEEAEGTYQHAPPRPSI
jgi:hypothetical protein